MRNTVFAFSLICNITNSTLFARSHYLDHFRDCINESNRETLYPLMFGSTRSREVEHKEESQGAWVINKVCHLGRQVLSNLVIILRKIDR